LRRLVKAFVINKFRGDPALLEPGLADLERRTGVATIGVLPWTGGLDLDAEDSLALAGLPARHPEADGRGTLDVAVVRFPRISNFTDLDALALEPGVAVRFVEDPAALGDPDLAVLPGTKATLADLDWLRARGFPEALARRRSTTVLGICGGYQMLGKVIHDPVESGHDGPVDGLGWLPVETRFEPGKVTRQRHGVALGHPVTGYQIHHGRTAPANPWVTLDDDHDDRAAAGGAGPEGAASDDGRVLGTSLHGLFESDGFRAAFLAEVARRRHKTFTPSGVSFAAAREAQFDRLADLLEAHADLSAIDRLIAEAAP
ncbi:MAG TPA: cobyric acid synthase, partial [Acidimicrobiia bacterium]|nr:cobyric acid synthase [Acidimicrobiia bacterium]